MIIVLASNKLDNPKMYDDNQDFMITALYAERSDVMRDAISYYNNELFNTYYKSGMNMEDVIAEYSPEDDSSDDDDEYNFIEKVYISEVIEEIAANISTLEEYDPKIIIAIEGLFGTLVTSKLNKIFRSNSVELEAVNLFQYYKISNLEALTKSVKSSLNTNFIYPEDPISFSYALYKFVNNK